VQVGRYFVVVWELITYYTNIQHFGGVGTRSVPDAHGSRMIRNWIWQEVFDA
jgi:hypothetical protein